MPVVPIRVLVIDDSALVRRLVTQALSADPHIQVVGTAVDPYAARDKMALLRPDVLTLDVEMPRMDGLEFLRIVMAQQPMPVVIISSATPRGSRQAIEALRLGAVEVLTKPDGPFSFGELGPRLIAVIKATRSARRLPRPVTPVVSQPLPALRRGSARDLILLGASTGGVEALTQVLQPLPAAVPPIAIVQHMPPMFTAAFAERLSGLCAVRVREAADGDRLQPGVALIAPGNFHLIVQRVGAQYAVRVTAGPPVWHQRPAVDVLFRSAAECGAAGHVIAGVLTGMGRDGAEGLLSLRQRGAITFAQDEATSAVYGMPRVAWETGAAAHQVPLGGIAGFLQQQYAADEAAIGS